MDRIDLDAILKKIAYLPGNRGEGEYSKACMKEAIHQALVLASEKAKIIVIDNSVTTSQNVWEPDYQYEIDKQSILDVEKLIV